MKLSVLLKNIDHTKSQTTGDPDIKGIAYDSRAVKPGFIFFALSGQKFDGNQFIEDAIDRGAVSIVSENKNLTTCPQSARVCVSDIRRSMAQAACFFFGNPSEKLRVIGITGTNGKTTVSLMLREILAEHDGKPGIIGTINYEIGDRVIPAQRTTPESPDIQNLFAQMKRIGCKTAVMEVSSHALVQQRVSGIEFDAVIFTNLTQDHLDYHGSMEEYFRAKTLMFPPANQGKKKLYAIVNIDDSWGSNLAKKIKDSGGTPITYGIHSEAMVRATNIKLTSEGSCFQTTSPWGDTEISMHLLGRFNISNALAAFACCGALGIEPNKTAARLAGITSVRGRLERVETGRDFSVFVDYAHTEDALKNVLTTLREITSGQLIVVFGCGGNRDRKKRPLMGAVVARLGDYAILTSDNPRQEKPADIIAEIKTGFEGCENYTIEEDRKEAIRKAISLARHGDTVLIAGKGHENYQEMTDRTIPFDDREIALIILKS